MNELKEIKLWDDWDDINLSTPERRIERLEILLCQKVHKGEDISQCLQVLEYLKNCTRFLSSFTYSGKITVFDG
ncbi:hypothetical protein ACWATR_36690 [Nostoc sp. UIC 10890]